MKDSEKAKRVLTIYSELLDGRIVQKSTEAHRFGVNEKTIQRDIEDIRLFLEQDEDSIYNTVIYDRMQKGYALEHLDKLKLSNPEVLAICKILLDSRALPKAEMKSVLNRLIACCVPESNRKRVMDLIRNEEFHYIEPQHKKKFLDQMWKIGQAIQESRLIEISYTRLKGEKKVERRLQPLAIMFSEYYFYLVAFIDDPELREHFDVVNDSFPTIYRIDRIGKCTLLEEHFHIPYANRFEEGEFRKRIQFMTGGRLRRIKFEYTGLSIESVLDRFPTAKILSEDEGKYLISAEVFGDGVDMWLRGQGDNIMIVKTKGEP